MRWEGGTRGGVRLLTKHAVPVEAWLVRHVHALFDGLQVPGAHGVRGQDGGAVHCAAADAKRPLVHVEVRAHAVAGAVQEVEPVGPERSAGEGVQHQAGGACGEDGARERRVTLEDSRVGAPFVVRRGAKVDRAGDVGGAVCVLPARVEQVDLAGRDWGALAVGGLVVNDGGVGAGGGDGGE
eukprot:scaffold4698_cov115-Isochrysis_galbana.AAC.5